MAIKALQHKMERSDSSHAILDSKSRKRKAEKILALLDEVIDLRKANILDIGCGSGQIAHEFSKRSAAVSSVDIVDERKERKGYSFKLTKSELLPFDDSIFDVVVTNHVIEHTPDQKKHISEVLRVLKPGGYVYLATPNKYWLTDPHYKLPFISWLPRFLSNRYLHLIHKKEWDIYPLSAHAIKKRFKHARVKNALPLLLRGKAASKLDVWKYAQIISRYMPKMVLDLTQYFSPTLIFLIQKKEQDKDKRVKM